MSGLDNWMWAMSEHDTKDRDPTTLAAMHALEDAYRLAGDSWKPSRVAAHLGDSAAGLRAILTGDEIAALEREQSARSDTAVRQRSRFNLWLLIAVAASTVAAALGGLQIFKELTWAMWPQGTAVGAVQFVALLVASLFWTLLWVYRPYRRWLLNRGAAEELRQAIFSTVIERANEASRAGLLDPGQPTVRQFALEYVRVGLLDDQIAWFCQKSGIARTEGVGIGLFRGAGLALTVSATLASGLAGAAQFLPDVNAALGPVAWMATGSLATLLTIIGAALLTAAQSADSALLSARNGARYREMANTLASLRHERLAEAQDAARAPAHETGADAATLFTLRVRELLAIEHAEWKAVLDHAGRQVSEQFPPLGGEG